MYVDIVYGVKEVMDRNDFEICLLKFFRFMDINVND